MRWLGLDVGAGTIGLAISDEKGVVAFPLRTLKRFGGKRDLESVARAVEETQAEALVLGLPLGLDGREGSAARRVKKLGEDLATHTGLVVHYWDERFSTAGAERFLVEADLRRERRKEVIDQAAAVFILQGFLDRNLAKKEDR
ncbi:MAG: Holliday junction resolvase RuvX [Pseudomonadota bacterium]